MSKSTKPITGFFFTPSILNTGTPAGLVGVGRLELHSWGVHIEAEKANIGLAQNLGCLFFVLGLAGGIALGVMGWVNKYLGASLALVGLFGGATVGRKLGGRRPISIKVPWTALTKAVVTSKTQVHSARLASHHHHLDTNVVDTVHLRFHLRSDEAKGVVLFIPDERSPEQMRVLEQSFVQGRVVPSGPRAEPQRRA